MDTFDREKFLALIQRCKGSSLYIQTHNFPDPDAIASAFGLQRLLEHYGVSSTLCYHGKIDKLSTKKMVDLFQIQMYSYSEIESGMGEKDPIICVDSQKNGGNILDFVGDEIACIDHHPTYAAVEYFYSDVRQVGSCATLIAQYYRELGVEMDADVASALLYGLRMDTAQFSRGVTLLDTEMFGYLFSRADGQKLASLEKNTMEFNDLRAYGSAIENIEVYGKVGIAAIPFSCPDALIAMVADFILSLEEVEVAIIYSLRGNEIKFSVRSEDPTVDAGELANQALQGYGNGGGHAEMAGGSIPEDNIQKLGEYPDAVIRERFLHVLEEMK